jgi:hypothetical protein
MIRLVEIVATSLILAFLAPLIAVERCCRVVLRVLGALRFDEVMALLIRVMRGEEKLVHVYGLLAKERVGYPSEIVNRTPDPRATS